MCRFPLPQPLCMPTANRSTTHFVACVFSRLQSNLALADLLFTADNTSGYEVLVRRIRVRLLQNALVGLVVDAHSLTLSYGELGVDIFNTYVLAHALTPTISARSLFACHVFPHAWCFADFGYCSSLATLAPTKNAGDIFHRYENTSSVVGIANIGWSSGKEIGWLDTLFLSPRLSVGN